MIILGLFNVILWIVEGLGNIVLPIIPGAVLQMLTFIMSLIDDGFTFVFQVLVDHVLVVAIAEWLINAWAVLFAFDAIFLILNKIRMAHSYENTL